MKTTGEDTPVIAGTQTLMNGLNVLKSVADGAQTLADVVRATSLTRSTAHRLIQALRAARFLRDTAEGTLALGPALIELGFQARDQVSLQSVARPILLDLAEEAKDTIHLAVEDHGECLYLDKVHGSRNVEIRSWPGVRMPLTYTGIGKALLLDSPERWEPQFVADRSRMERQPQHDFSSTRAFVNAMHTYAEQGFAYDLEENEPGIRCVAAPIHDATGAVAGAISVSAMTQVMPPRRMKSLGPVVRAAADRISVELGARPAR
ncbi:IclR family transcriptional regulator [Bifidobacterium sp. DSM 109958]|uniref:IclR family transcriptional regulator n=1 Tax=Bifidobacterium moraviense TaxID=2675323 RepID=A0A7Y0HZM3_9BIFI|nr:IclR family transcriptional regulator [Bifidobacterium sp. DSM 109958]NMN00969.1 IclR family transcriptional regulator [Bifidobacterium sp. DSM 109958]